MPDQTKKSGIGSLLKRLPERFVISTLTLLLPRILYTLLCRSLIFRNDKGVGSWEPVPIDKVTPERIVEVFTEIYKLALYHFNGTCGRVGCDCKEYIFEAGMTVLAESKQDESEMWKENSSRNR